MKVRSRVDSSANYFFEVYFNLYVSIEECPPGVENSIDPFDFVPFELLLFLNSRAVDLR